LDEINSLTVKFIFTLLKRLVKTIHNTQYVNKKLITHTKYVNKNLEI